jgi:hypothetical protein
MTTSAHSGPTQVFYRYQDASGRVYIVDSRDKLPGAAREGAQRIELNASQTGQPQGALDAVPWASSIDAPSFLLGFGAALFVGVVVFGFRRGGSGTLAKVVAGGALLVAVGGAYLGWLRSTTGQGDSLMSSPKELVDDARRAVQQVEQRRKERDAVLDDLKRENP